jgi:hypothetical protein
MKIGIICPVADLQIFAGESRFHLILPHLYDLYPGYYEFYAGRIAAGDFVLQDNSVFELEHSLDYKFLLTQAETLGVTEMVAPEVLLNPEACTRVLEEFLTHRQKEGSKIPVLCVAQGTNMTELLTHFFAINQYSDVASLGLPFDLDWQEGPNVHVRSRTLRRVLNRWDLVTAIDTTAKLRNIPIKPVHLMGLSDPVELQRYREIPWIRSNDSSSAYVHGAAGILIGDRGLPCEKIPTKLDFGSSIVTDTQLFAVKHNIRMIRTFASTEGIS